MNLTQMYADYLAESGSVGIIPPELLTTVIVIVAVAFVFGLFVGRITSQVMKD